MADEAYLTYRITFPSRPAAVAAADRLLSAGFAVNEVGVAQQRVILEAGMVGAESLVDEALDQALAGIEHDPQIPWHAARLNGIFDPRS